MPSPLIHNPQLEGDPFFWHGGPNGILLIHSYTATTAEVRPLACCLCEHGYTVAGPLLPGHYTTPEDANRYTWRDWTAAVEVAYRELTARCPRVIVGGESAGAVLSLYLASEHPEVQAVLCYAPALRLTLSPQMALLVRVLALVRPSLPKGRIGNAEQWQGYTVNPLKGAVQLLNLQRVVRGRLPRIQQPVLIMQGRLDEAVAAQAPLEVYDGVRSAVKELYWLEDSVHTLLLGIEQQQAFETTLRFVERAFGKGEA
jgi:carboxylesterase